MKTVYSYYFETVGKLTGTASLVEGGGQTGMMMSYGWHFDGQVFVKTKVHPYNGKYDKPKIMIVVK